MQDGNVRPYRLKYLGCRIREALKKEGNEVREMKVKCISEGRDLRKVRVSLDVQVNRSAEAGNKISIYCAVEAARWRRVKMGA